MIHIFFVCLLLVLILINILFRHKDSEQLQDLLLKNDLTLTTEEYFTEVNKQYPRTSFKPKSNLLTVLFAILAIFSLGGLLVAAIVQHILLIKIFETGTLFFLVSIIPLLNREVVARTEYFQNSQNVEVSLQGKKINIASISLSSKKIKRENFLSISILSVIFLWGIFWFWF